MTPSAPIEGALYKNIDYVISDEKKKKKERKD